jgi:hypothetical protein
VVRVHPDVMLQIVNERQAQMRREAAADRRAREARHRPGRMFPEAVELPATLRLDCVGDAARLYQLAALSERPLVGGRFVLAEVDGRVVAALPVDGGAPIADPFELTEHLVPLLRLRAMQVRGVDVRLPRLRRALPIRV